MKKYNDGFDDAREALGEKNINSFLASMGMGPDYIPKEPKKYICSQCNKKDAYYKEIHPDTDMNDIVLWCPNCRKEIKK